MLYVGFSNVMCILGYQSPFILIQWGWLVSWVYLRFYKKNSMEGVATLSGAADTYGDRSDAFAFINWFPPFVHQPLGMVLDFVYQIALQVKIVPAYSSTDLESGSHAPMGGGIARAEAERRRAMALKALDQRMASTAGPASRPPQPSQPPAPGPARAPAESKAGDNPDSPSH